MIFRLFDEIELMLSLQKQTRSDSIEMHFKDGRRYSTRRYSLSFCYILCSIVCRIESIDSYGQHRFNLHLWHFLQDFDDLRILDQQEFMSVEVLKNFLQMLKRDDSLIQRMLEVKRGMLLVMFFF